MRKRRLQKEFFERDVLAVARDLLGKYIVTTHNGEERAYRIVDVEAYDGEGDKACHASKGRTARTEVMYGPAGVWYVYLIYGMYHILNIITGEEEYPAGVMIRAIEGVEGPGRVTAELGVTRKHNKKTSSYTSGLWIEDRGENYRDHMVEQLPRVNVSYAGEWAEKPYRFKLQEIAKN